MNKEQIFEELQPIIADRLAREMAEVTLDKTLYDLKADSLDFVEVMMEVETHWNISIPDIQMEKFTDIQSIVDYISTNI